VTKRAWFGTGLLLVACGGASAPQVEPAQSGSSAVRSFMQAVADSNLAKMAAFWGTTNGPASKTNQPPDWQRRIAIMRAYLRNDSFRIMSDVAEQNENRRAQQVEIRRRSCTWTVPFVTVKTRDGSWLVTQVDLAAAGNPARPCVEPGDSVPQG
jgi:hypothetical protein